MIFMWVKLGIKYNGFFKIKYKNLYGKDSLSSLVLDMPESKVMLRLPEILSDFWKKAIFTGNK